MNSKLDTGCEQLPVNILVASDDLSSLTAIHKLLEPIGRVTTVESQQAMLSTFRLKKYDFVIFGFESESNIDDVRIINSIKQTGKAVKIIKILYHDNAFNIRCLLNFGVEGFIRIEDVKSGKLSNKVNKLFSKDFYLDDIISSMLIKDEINPLHQKLSSRLTKKECEVILLVFRGDSVTDVAKKTNRSVKTISGQKVSAMKKLDAKNNFELFTLLSMLNQHP
ncbi:LuxR C-terminal-related transcriptional regulator [Serratia quinivorans]|uniref:LuxR C-terminal-related transcriptional regulator n=1 Tax=Serratia quinivorans TaxID=137545 RepID=UPI002178CBED|nr:LuxR C-terminal-related transcriptional regulator [Serratia quinivorans]CAI1071932.1 Capsular synthesis regulator component B [Serratia quinivorans]